MTEPILTVDRDRPRFNCRTCGSFCTAPSDVPVGYGSDLADVAQIECPRCRSVYAVASAGHDELLIELAVRQNEYTPSRPGVKRVKPQRDAIYACPVFGPIRRAQDRIRAAERDLALAMASAHRDAGKSIREVAQVSGFKKSRTHELISAVEVKPEPLPPIPVLDTDEIVF